MEALDTQPGTTVESRSTADPDRELARKRLQDRRDFGAHAVAYVVINTFLLGAWALTGAGYFWPAWVLAAWGAGLALHGWETFVRRPITDADVDNELRSLRR
jgi:2TM domain